MKCMNCETIVDTAEFSVIESCPKCKGKFIVEFEASAIQPEKSKDIKPKESSTKVEAPTDATKPAKKEEEEKEADLSKDLNLQTDLRLHFFKGGKDEKFVTLFSANAVPNEKYLDDEKYVVWFD